MGLAGYYRKFIRSFSSIAAPLLQLTQNAANFTWTDACEQAFQLLKQLLCSAPILAYPDFGKDFVLQLHDGPLGGHLGFTRSEEQVRQHFYWPGIRKTVTKHIQLCQVCNHKNSPINRNTAPLGHISVSQPFTFWAMDYMGPLPETSRGNKHILVVVDHFTKWCEAFATTDQKASRVAPLLVSRIFSRFVPPAVLHSDKGRNFESTLLHEICNFMGITKTRTTSYHPQCDGQTERQNRTIQAMLSAFASKQKDDWDLWLDSS